ncbi:MAG: Crp/Fnr family transcriptional regulator [Wenzhouxiangellaceae bacterium]|nr:Crp/Fnr family transcriptional regulator [Wenzhouxiangellaceae bacterium]
MLDSRHVPPAQIRSFKVFEGLTDRQARQLARRARTECVDAGDLLYRQRDVAHHAYFCISGQFRLFRENSAGCEKIFRIVDAGNCISDPVSLSDDRRFSLNCAALRASEVLLIDAAELARVFHQNEAVRTGMLNELSRRVDHLIDHIEMLSMDKAKYRVAAFIFSEYLRNERRIKFRLSLNKKHIASYLSLQPETLSRCIRWFGEQGVTDSTAHEVHVLDVERLETLALNAQALP